jgi:hypothetical protein
VSDLAKYIAAIANLGWELLDLVDDVLDNPPPTCLYENLKAELIRRLVEAQDMGDRTPSQFYQDMKKLTALAVSDDFILTMWRNRLPANTRAILALSKITSTNELIEIADRIHEVRLEANAARTSSTQYPIPSPRQRTEQHRGTERTQLDERERILKRLAAVTIDLQRRSRSISRSRRLRRRSISRKREQQPGWCYYHKTFQTRARKCRSPCS